MGAAAGRNAAVIGANIGIVAIGGTTANTLLVGTYVGGGASIVVVTRGGVGRIYTPLGGVAAVVGTDVGIVTVLGPGTITNTARAHIRNGARVAIVTAKVIGHIDAATLRGTAIVSANVAVVAVEWNGANALTQFTDVLHSAGAAVVARSAVQIMGASCNGMAVIGGTDVIVVAILGPGWHAFAATTVVAYGTRILIIAVCVVGGLNAGTGVITGIIGAGVAIVAFLLQSGLTEAIAAEVILGTWVAVRAGSFDVLVLAAPSRKANILGAWVTVITLQ